MNQYDDGIEDSEEGGEEKDEDGYGYLLTKILIPTQDLVRHISWNSLVLIC